MGSGRGSAFADTEITYPKITVVNGGKTKVFFYTVLNNPARVKAPVVGTITEYKTGRWGYKLHIVVPRTLQIVAGVPIALRTLHVEAGRGDWIATTGCPADKKWPYHVDAFLSDYICVEHGKGNPAWVSTDGAATLHRR